MKPIASYHDDLLRRLKKPKYAISYLNASLEQGDDADFFVAFRDVVHAHGGFGRLSKKTGLSREHLFKMLSKSGNPRFHSLRQLMDAMGFRLHLEAA